MIESFMGRRVTRHSPADWIRKLNPFARVEEELQRAREPGEAPIGAMPTPEKTLPKGFAEEQGRINIDRGMGKITEPQRRQQIDELRRRYGQ